MPTTDRPSLPTAFVCVLALTFIVFLPALSASWVSLGDPETLLEHEAWRGLGPDALTWMWTHAHMGHYTPLTWMSLGLDHAIWGMDPRGYHLTNVVLHSLSAGVVFLVLERGLRRATSDARRVVVAAALGALLFGVHPLQVESVAWISARRDVLSTLLLTGVLYAWVRYVEHTDRRWFFAAVALYGLSLAAKAQAVALPLLLLVLDAWPFRRQGWRALLVEKLPLAALAAAFAGLAFWAQGPLEAEPGWAERLGWAADVLPAEASMVADRLGVALLLPVAALTGLGLAVARSRAWVLGTLPVLIVLGLGTWRQTKVWTNSLTLWGSALRLDPDNDVVMGQLASAYLIDGNPLASLPLYERALATGPARPLTLLQYGIALGNLGRYAQAISVWEQIPTDAPEAAQARAFTAQARALMEE